MAPKASEDVKWHSRPPKPPNRDNERANTDLSEQKDFSSASSLAASFTYPDLSPSKDTNITKDVELSQSTSKSPSVKKAISSTRKNLVKPYQQNKSYKHIDDSTASRLPVQYRLIQFTDKRSLPRNIYVSEETIDRLEECYREDDNFEKFLRTYLIRKYENSTVSQFPYTVPDTFYCLCRVVCKVTCELFADAISYSGILQDFCSADVNDEAFGSLGKWEDLDETVSGGAGIPPFSETMVTRVVKSCERLVTRDEPFCRIYILPYQHDGVLAKIEKKYPFYGHIVAVMKPDTLNLKHQREFFEANKELLFRDWRPNIRTAVVIWVNEAYLWKNPIPSDVDECFTAWVLEAIGTSAVLDYEALLAAFPNSCRNADERLLQLML